MSKITDYLLALQKLSTDEPKFGWIDGKYYPTQDEWDLAELDSRTVNIPIPDHYVDPSSEAPKPTQTGPISGRRCHIPLVPMAPTHTKITFPQENNQLKDSSDGLY